MEAFQGKPDSLAEIIREGGKGERKGAERETDDGNNVPSKLKSWADWLAELRFYMPLDTKQVISEMLFPANVLTSTEKTKK